MKHLIALSMIVLLVPTAAVAGRCGDDKAKFCKGVQDADMDACLKQHMIELSDTCKEKLEAKAPEQAPADKKPD